jgi:hypothetical protein
MEARAALEKRRIRLRMAAASLLLDFHAEEREGEMPERLRIWRLRENHTSQTETEPAVLIETSAPASALIHVFGTRVKLQLPATAHTVASSGAKSSALRQPLTQTRIETDLIERHASLLLDFQGKKRPFVLFP